MPSERDKASENPYEAPTSVEASEWWVWFRDVRENVRMVHRCLVGLFLLLMTLLFLVAIAVNVVANIRTRPVETIAGGLTAVLIGVVMLAASLYMLKNARETIGE